MPEARLEGDLAGKAKADLPIPSPDTRHSRVRPASAETTGMPENTARTDASKTKRSASWGYGVALRLGGRRDAPLPEVRPGSRNQEAHLHICPGLCATSRPRGCREEP